jgi:PAS domain-containing protein
VGNQFPHRHHAWFNDWCQRHDIDPCDGDEHVTRWDENLHPDEGPEATRRFSEHVNGKAEYYDAEYRIRTRSGNWRWVFERGRVVERDANGKAVRMLGVCMDLDETKVAERQANARNERVEAALQLTTAGVWDWDVENGITYNTDGYYRVFGVEPSFGRANHMNWRQLLGTDPENHIDDFRRRLQRVGAHEQCSRPSTASATPTAAGTGRWIAPTWWTARPMARPAACWAWWSTSPTASCANWRSRRPTSASVPCRANCAA